MADPGITALRDGITKLKDEITEEMRHKKGAIYTDRLAALEKLDNVLERQSATEGDSYGS